MKSLKMAVKHTTSLITGFSAIFNDLSSFFPASPIDEPFLLYAIVDPLLLYFL
jgi:hypothetical protein